MSRANSHRKAPSRVLPVHGRGQSSSFPCLSSSSSATSSTSSSAFVESKTCVDERKQDALEVGTGLDECENDGRKRLRVMKTAFEFGRSKAQFDESSERTVRETVGSFYDVMGKETSTKSLADTDAKVFLMRFPGLVSGDPEVVREEMFQPLLSKLSHSNNAGSRETAAALSTILVQLELMRTYQCLMLDSVRRIELGMRSSPSARTSLSPPQVPSPGLSKPECTKQQLDQLQVYVKLLVVRFFHKDVVGVRKKSTRSCFTSCEESVPILDALKGLSESAAKLFDYVLLNFSAPATSKEWVPYLMATYTGTKANFVHKMKTEGKIRFSPEIFMIVQAPDGSFDPTFIWQNLASQVLYIVNAFTSNNSNSCASYRFKTNVQELHAELQDAGIDVYLVCAYLVIVNQNTRNGIFHDVSEFTCTDTFLGSCFWFLMKEVFVPATEENQNLINGFELNTTQSPATAEAYKQHCTVLYDSADHKFIFMESLLERKKDLFSYFFLSRPPENHTSEVDVNVDDRNVFST